MRSEDVLQYEKLAQVTQKSQISFDKTHAQRRIAIRFLSCYDNKGIECDLSTLSDHVIFLL